MRFFFLSICLLFIFLFLNFSDAKNPGTYFDYIYLSNYQEPTPVQEELNCSFFFTTDTSPCAILDKIPSNLKEQITLSLIKKLDAQENQEWVRYWNSKVAMPTFENATFPPSNYSDGIFFSNNSLQNAWVKILYIYPSVFDEKDQAFYLPSQSLLLKKSNLDFVINDTKDSEEICKEEYFVSGYTYDIVAKIEDYQTRGLILPISNLFNSSEKKNLTILFSGEGKYQKRVFTKQNSTTCEGLNCTIVINCVLNSSSTIVDKVEGNFSLSIKFYPDILEYQNLLAVPQKGFANGIVHLKLPKDFLKYELKIKDNIFIKSKNDLKLVKRGKNYPLLQLNLIPSPSQSGNLYISSLNESEDENYYYATLVYRIYLDQPNISSNDCNFKLYTPFYQKTIEQACDSSRSIPSIKLEIKKIENSKATILAKVTDQLDMPMSNAGILFSGEKEKKIIQTDSKGVGQIEVDQREDTFTLGAIVLGSEEYGSAKAFIFVPGKGINQEKQKIKGEDLVGFLIVIFLIILSFNLLMKWSSGKRSTGSFSFLFFFLFFSIFSSFFYSQQADYLQTLEACKNYDFDNAIRHFGECAESYRAVSEFNAMRTTANIIITNIAFLVVATPNIEPYKTAYSNMVAIALALFRVAWAFNSLYLILNIFNPKKRAEALAQYIWLGVFVILSFVSYSIITQSVNLLSGVSQWIVGQEPAEILTKSTISAEFLAENYEILKLLLPFLNLSYLILLSRYILFITLFLFFPFTLLLFFNSSTKGFGKALLGITFMVFVLSLINSILLLIYKMFVEIGDITLQNTLGSTFFSASFIVFFGFVDLLVIVIAIISAIALIGGK
ncbi:MAG: hypothetical protein ACK4J0_03685 [Candidatus Anstonellaceae archaeon]